MDAYMRHKVDNVFDITDIVTVYYLELVKDYTFSGERHDFWEMVYVDKGEIIATAENENVVLRENELIFHKPNEFHAANATGKAPANIFIISFVCNSEKMKCFEKRRMKLPAKLKNLISLIMDESVQLFEEQVTNPSNEGLSMPENQKYIGAQQLIRIYMEQFLIMLIRNRDLPGKNKIMFGSREAMENNLVKEIIAYLEEKIYSRVTIEELCEHLHCAKTSMCSVFKSVTGYTIMQYYTMLKISEAKTLIRQKSYNCAEISDMLSFGSPYYFSKIFKKITGVPPKEYIKSVKK